MAQGTDVLKMALRNTFLKITFFVGQMAAIALLQNGHGPKCFSEDLPQTFLLVKREKYHHVLKHYEGPDSMGIHMFCRKFP